MISNRHRDRLSAGTRLRSIVQAELGRRRTVNASYSLRAFARSLELDHSTLSQLLRGKRTMTWRSIRTIGAGMRWSGAAMLRLVEEPGFRFDSRAIAGRLEISVDEVNILLTDLCLMGLVQLRRE